ncbi:MAG: YgjV family protein [Clostridia bacterium]|nr:YgjV family protein [Clostridia bacterium]
MYSLLFINELSKNIVDGLDGALGIGYPILFNAIGILSIFLQFMIFQMQDRKKIIIVSIFSNIGWLSYFALQGDLISGTANIIGIMSNIIFLLRGKYRWADSKWWLVFFLAVAGGFSLFTFKVWNDVFAFMASLSTTVAFFMLKENNIRKISLFSYCMFVCNSISKLYLVALIADITAIISVVTSLIRYSQKEKEKGE